MLRAPAAIAAASRRNHADEAFTARRSSGRRSRVGACAYASPAAHRSTARGKEYSPHRGGVRGGPKRARARCFRAAVSDPKETTDGHARVRPRRPSDRVRHRRARASDDADRDASVSASAAAAIPLAFFALLIGVGAYYKEDINEFLTWFTGYVESLGPSGPALFMVLYVAHGFWPFQPSPLTMSAGAIFGPVQGTAMVSVSATLAATAGFLIARYALRVKIRSMADEYPQIRGDRQRHRGG